MKALFVLSLSLLAATSSLAAGKSCDALKTEIAAKIEAKGVKNFTLEALPADAQIDAKVVGTCESGTKKLVYTKK